MSQIVISRNYQNRGNQTKPWLVRKMGQPYEEALPVSEVRATGVKFQQSDAYEAGFGCSTVAVADEANVQTFEFNSLDDQSPVARESDLKRLRFNGYGFLFQDAFPGTYASGVSRLVLKCKGGMFARA